MINCVVPVVARLYALAVLNIALTIKEPKMTAYVCTASMTDEQKYARIKAHMHLVGYGSDEYKQLKKLLDYLYRKIHN